MCGALTIQRHHDTVRKLQRRTTRKEHQACAPWERQLFAKCPRWWHPHDNGDTLRSPPTQNVKPCTYLHHASFNIHTGSTRRDGNRSCRIAMAAVSQKHKRMLTSSHTFVSLNSQLAVSECPNHDTPPRHGVLSGKNWRHASQTWRFSGWTARTANLASLKKPRASPWITEGVCSHKKKSCLILVLVHRACQNARAEKRQQDKWCHRRCQKSVPSSVPS